MPTHPQELMQISTTLRFHHLIVAPDHRWHFRREGGGMLHTLVWHERWAEGSAYHPHRRAAEPLRSGLRARWNHEVRAADGHEELMIVSAADASCAERTSRQGSGYNRPRKVPPGIVPRCGCQPRERSPVRRCDIQSCRLSLSCSRPHSRSGRTRSRTRRCQ